eukprot:GILJ01001496.1.p1 GENE.GILJ01001496.1~~GILJ01001496.1.p1  ORF type:complete len:429 (+),score=85.94 GILJ01001496.1:38-1324(+)
MDTELASMSNSKAKKHALLNEGDNSSSYSAGVKVSHTSPPIPALAPHSFLPSHGDGADLTFFGGLFKALSFRESYLNILLLCIPISLVSYVGNWGPSSDFVLSFFSIIPLAKLLGNATEDIALRTSESVGGLLNATFGNAVELIIAVIALKDNLLEVVQASLIGSVLSNLLLVTGTAFFLGGITGGRVQSYQSFSQIAASTNASLMTLAAVAFIIPAAFVASSDLTVDSYEVLSLSRGTAIIILTIYIFALIFQLKTHAKLFETPAQEVEEEEEAQLTLAAAIILLAVSTLIVSLESELLVRSIDSVSVDWGLTHKFIGLILIPIVGNAAEHATAITVAMRDKMDLAISVCVGSSNQIALGLAPFLVLISWMVGRSLTLCFDMFETVMLFGGVLIFNSCISDGKSNWLEGMHLIAVYILIAVGIFYHP